MEQNQPQIIKVKELLSNDNLKIPSYQRPYKWTTSIAFVFGVIAGTIESGFMVK
jgi:hypothetical protein